MVNKITFTGVDNRTDIRKLQEIYKAFPFVEFGILMSMNNTGSDTVNRFPHPLVIKNIKHAGIPYSVHVCGKLVRDAISTGQLEAVETFLADNGAGAPNQIQLNIKGFDKYEPFVCKGAIPIIIQVSDTKAAGYYELMRAQSENVHALFDISGGKGISGLNGGFDLGFDADGYVGFAGGLNPENVAFALGYITAGKQNDHDFWIDMESGVRTDDWFDTEKVLAVCETAAPLMGYKKAN